MIWCHICRGFSNAKHLPQPWNVKWSFWGCSNEFSLWNHRSSHWEQWSINPIWLIGERTGTWPNQECIHTCPSAIQQLPYTRSAARNVITTAFPAQYFPMQLVQTFNQKCYVVCNHFIYGIFLCECLKYASSWMKICLLCVFFQGYATCIESTTFI